MSVDQAREEWQAAGDYDSACRLIRAQSAHIVQLEQELVAERENNVGEFESRSEAERKVRALKAQVVGLERELAEVRADGYTWRDLALKRGDRLSAEKALADDLDGGLGVAQDIIEAASKQLTKKAGTKWGIWYLDRVLELRAAYRKARGL